ncbi:adenylosuccinate synthetase 2, chloroplastic [Tanacetum coccineum]
MNITSLRPHTTTTTTPPRRHTFTTTTLPHRISFNNNKRWSKHTPISAVTIDEQTSSNVPSRIEKLSQVSGVLGCQWGDEGKGKLVDILAKHFDIVARCQVGVATLEYLRVA